MDLQERAADVGVSVDQSKEIAALRAEAAEFRAKTERLEVMMVDLQAQLRQPPAPKKAGRTVVPERLAEIPAETPTGRRQLLRGAGIAAAGLAVTTLAAGTSEPALADFDGTLHSGGASTANYGVVAVPGNGTAPPTVTGTYGVIGFNTASATDPGDTAGVCGSSTAGYGVLGASTSDLAGVLGTCSNGSGVQGLSQTGSSGPGIAGVYGENQGAAANPGVLGVSFKGPGVQGQSQSGSGPLGSGFGVEGQSGSGYGVYGISSSSGGARGDSSSFFGVVGTSSSSHGIYGQTTGGAGTAGVLGVNGGNSNGPGVIGQSSGGVGMQGTSSSNFGVYGTSTSNHGVYGNSNSAIGTVGASNTGVGVLGMVNSGGYGGQFVGQVFVEGNFSVTGVKSAVVPFGDGSHRRVYCVESPESWFEDFGAGQLTGGQANVTLDPDFAQTVKTDSYYVFLTPQGDCKGLFVSGQTASGFTVQELQAGTSTIHFSYRVVAKRKDVDAPRLEKVDVPAVPTFETPPVPTIKPLASPVDLAAGH